MKKEIARYYRAFHIPWNKYMKTVALPLVVLAVVMLMAFQYIESSTVLVIPPYAMWAIPIFLAVLPLLLPLIISMGRKAEIERYMHLFITRMCILASSNNPRLDVLKEIAEIDEYGVLGEEIRKLYHLVDSWGRTFQDASKYVARRTPSKKFADFLERQAISAEAGEEFDVFLEKEREVIMHEYEKGYDRTLKSVDSIKDLFMSVVISALFVLIFVSLMPLFMDIGTSTYLILSAVLIMASEGLILYYAYVLVPSELLWHDNKTRPTKEKNIKIIMNISLVVSLFLFILLYKLLDVPFLVLLSLSCVPIAYPAYRISRMEVHIKEMDDKFEPFLRSMGAYLETDEAAMIVGLDNLNTHDFGFLSRYIKELYNRIVMKIDTLKAWKQFAIDSGSNLISKFTEMFIVGITSGAKRRYTLKVISENYKRVLEARKKRYLIAGNFMGTFLGLSVAFTFTLYLAKRLLMMLNAVFSDMATPETTEIAIPLTQADFNVNFILIIFTIMIIGHTAVSAGILRLVNGGHRITFYMYFVIFLWVNTLTALLSDKALSSLITM